MSDSKKRNKSKNIPVLKRKHVRTQEISILKSDKNSTLISDDFRTAVTKAVTEAVTKSIPSIVEDVLQELENKSD